MNNTIKQRYFDKIYANAKEIECSCGCGEIIKDKDRFGRDKCFINGHNGRKYDDPTQYKREWNHRNREKRHKYRNERITKLKLELIAIKGNKCEDCEYLCDGTNGRAFDFHHKNPSEKLFALNAVSLDRYSRKKILEELEKCKLLCARCHRLRH
jgi:hypothetical protein